MFCFKLINYHPNQNSKAQNVNNNINFILTYI